VQQLHLVGFTTDRRGLIFSVRRGAKSGGYTIAVDDDLFSAIDDARAWLAEAVAEEGEAARTTADERQESQLSVREVQSRLRQGWTIDEVATDAGVDPAWVARFAAPVLTEQAEVIRAVRAARLTKRTGVSGAALGDAVYRNLAERGCTPPRDQLDRQWSARQLSEGLWEVTFAYTFRRRDHSVRWSYDVEHNKVAPRDRLASLLGFRPGGPPPTPSRPRAVGLPTVTDVDEPPPPKRRAQDQKRLVAARKAAAATMAAEARKAGRRNAVAARKAAAAKRTPRPAQPAQPTPTPEPAEEPPAVERSHADETPTPDDRPSPAAEPDAEVVDQSTPDPADDELLEPDAPGPNGDDWLSATWDGPPAAPPPASTAIPAPPDTPPPAPMPAPTPAPRPARREEPLRATRGPSATEADGLDLSGGVVRIRDDLAPPAGGAAVQARSDTTPDLTADPAPMPPRRRRQLRAR
jgi:hypothetical protein